WLLARRHERRLAAACGPGGADRDEDLGGSLRRMRNQRRDTAHRGCEGSQEDPCDQRGRRGADLRERRLRRRRRPARNRAGDQRRVAKGPLIGALVLGALLLVVGSSTLLRTKFLVE